MEETAAAAAAAAPTFSYPQTSGTQSRVDAKRFPFYIFFLPKMWRKFICIFFEYLK